MSTTKNIIELNMTSDILDAQMTPHVTISIVEVKKRCNIPMIYMTTTTIRTDVDVTNSRRIIDVSANCV